VRPERTGAPYPLPGGEFVRAEPARILLRFRHSSARRSLGLAHDPPMSATHDPARSDARASRRELLALGAAAAVLPGCAAQRVHTAAPSSPETAPETTREAPSARDERSRLDELFSGLSDQSGGEQPIQPSERAARRRRASILLQERGLNALVCEGGRTMEYLTGVSWGHSERLFAFVMLDDGSHFWIAPAFEEQRALLSIHGADGPGGDIVTWQEHEYAWKPLAAALADFRASNVCIDPSARYFLAERLATVIGPERISSGGDVVRALRMVKDAHELQLLRRAAELTQTALAAVAQHVEPGQSEEQISAMVRHAQRRLGLSSVWDLSLLGPSAAYPHGDDRHNIAKEGEFLLVDTGGSLHGYQSDISRTWVVGGREPGARESKAWFAVRDAQLRAFETAGPGTPCNAVDLAARESLAAAGYGRGYEHFTHRLGHGIGLEGHEDPYFDSGSEVELAPGMTLSDEPGLYFPGEFGVRLEDVLTVTSSGAEVFGKWQRSPTSPEG
jgi:Xaa-Pro dipeptidase